MKTPKKRKRVKRTELFFNKDECERYLRTDQDGFAIAAKCNLWVMANLVRDFLTEYGEKAHDAIARHLAKKRRVVELGIEMHQLAAEIALSERQTEKALQLVAEADYGRDNLARMIEESRPKILGALHGRAMPGAKLYLLLLEEYIAAKMGTFPHRKKIAHIVSALLAGFDRDEGGIDPELLAKNLKNLRKQSPPYVQAAKEVTVCDSSGQNVLDRIYGKAFIADRI